MLYLLLTPIETHQTIPRLNGSAFTYNEAEDKVIQSSLPDATTPYLLVNIGSGVSFFHVTDDQKCERVTGSSFGGSALCGLLTLLTKARDFDEMLELAGRGDNANVDKLIGDIYGMDYNRIGMKMTAVASSFCKAFSMPYRSEEDRETIEDGNSQSFSDADICHSLVFAVFNNIGQLATLQSRIYGNVHIFFTGPYVRENHLIMRTLCVAVRYYSGGEKRSHVVVDSNTSKSMER